MTSRPTVESVPEGLRLSRRATARLPIARWSWATLAGALARRGEAGVEVRSGPRRPMRVDGICVLSLSPIVGEHEPLDERSRRERAQLCAPPAARHPKLGRRP